MYPASLKVTSEKDENARAFMARTLTAANLCYLEIA